jgi:hypothetical protein
LSSFGAVYKKVLMSAKYIHNYTIVLIVLALGCYSYIAIQNGVVTWADPLVGFEAMTHWLQGGAWNTIEYYNINATMQPAQYYLNWWAPGQYMVPWLFIKLLGVNIPVAQIITIVLAGSISVVGYYKLMKLLNINTVVLHLVLIVLVFNRNFFWHYLVYFGGETLLWAATPWLCYVLIKQFNFSYTYMCIAFVVGVTGVFLKSSFVITYMAIGAYLFFQTTLSVQQLLQIQRWKPYVAMIASVACVYIFYLSKGATPSTVIDMTMTNDVPNTLLADFVHPWSAMVTHFFKIADILQHFAPKLNSKGIDVAWLFLPFMFMSVLLCFYFIKKRTEHNVYLLAVLVYVVTASIFTFYYLQNKAISYETRHYYYVGNIAGIAILQLLYTNYQRVFVVVISVLLLLSAVDFIRFFARAQQLQKEYTWFNGIKIERKVAPAMHIINSFINKDSTLNIHCDATYTRALFKQKCKLICMSQHPINKELAQNVYIGLDNSKAIKLPIKCTAKKTLIIYTGTLKNSSLATIKTRYATSQQYVYYYHATPNYTIAIINSN